MNGSQNNKLDYPNYYSENNINQTRLANLDLINSYPTSSNLVDNLPHQQQPNQIASNQAQPQSSTSIPRYNSTPLIPNNNTPNSKIQNPLNFVRNQPETGTIEEGSTNSVSNINQLYYPSNFPQIINAPTLQTQQPGPNSQYCQVPYMMFDPQTQSFVQAILIPQFMPIVSNGNTNNDDYLYQSHQPNFIRTFPPELYNNNIFSQNNNNNQQQQQFYLDNSTNNMYYDNEINDYQMQNYIAGNIVGGVDLEQINMNNDDKDGVNQISQTKTQSLPSIHNESLDSDSGPSSDEDQDEDMLHDLQNISFFRNISNVPVNNSNNKGVVTSKTVTSTNVPNLPQATVLVSTTPSVVPSCQTCSINNNDFSATVENSSVGSGIHSSSSSRFKKTRIKERTMIWNSDQITVKDNLVTLLSELEIGRAKEWSVFDNLDQFELQHFGGYIVDLDLDNDTLTKPISPSKPNSEPICIHEKYLHKQLSPPPPPKNPPPPPPPAPSNISTYQQLQEHYSNSKRQNKSTSSLLPPKYQQQSQAPPSISSPSTPFLNQQYHFRHRKSLQIPIPVYINQYHTQQHTIPIVSPVPQSHVPYLSNPVSSAHVNNNSNNILTSDQHYKLTNPNSNLFNNTNKCCGSNSSVNKRRRRRWSVAGNSQDNSLVCPKAGLIDSHNTSFNFNNSHTPTHNQSSSHDSNNVHSTTTPSDDWMQQNDLDLSTLGCSFNTFGNVNAASIPYHRSNFELKFDQQLMKLKKSIMSQFDQYLGDMRKEILGLRSKNRELDLELRNSQRHLRNTTQRFYDQVPQSDLANYSLIVNEDGRRSVDIGVGGTKDIDINTISVPTDFTNTVITTTCSTTEPH